MPVSNVKEERVGSVLKYQHKLLYKLIMSKQTVEPSSIDNNINML